MPRKPPDRPGPTLATIARLTGVSPMTASRALNDRPGVSREKRDEIRSVARRVGYTPPRTVHSISADLNGLIGVVVELHAPIAAQILQGAGEAVRAIGYEMLIYSVNKEDHRPPAKIVDLLKRFADGVVVLFPLVFDYLHALGAARVPVVTVEHGDQPLYPSIVADNYGGAQEAMRHLHELGHRRIALVVGDERLVSARERKRAYIEAVGLSGEIDPDLVVPGDFTQPGGYAAARKLLALRPRPTALFCANDLCAIGAWAALRDAGLRVPEDVSLVGFDDVGLASQLYPPLTTVRQPMEAMGQAAVNTVLALGMGLNAPTQVITLPTELMVRGTTAPPASSGRRRADG